MLSTLVFMPPTLPAARRQSALLCTLAALVPIAVDGVIRDVALLQSGDEDGLPAIADEAGCRVVAGRDFGAVLAQGAIEARSPWVLVLQAGAAPTRLFGEEAARALEAPSGREGGLLLREQPRGGLARWLPALAPAVGVALTRVRLTEARCLSFADVLRRARPARSLPTPVPVHR